MTIVGANPLSTRSVVEPAVEAQATDRAYRLGQLKEVHVYLPILEDRTGRIARTFDQLLDEVMEGKKGLA